MIIVQRSQPEKSELLRVHIVDTRDRSYLLVNCKLWNEPCISSRYKFDNAFPPPADQEELFEGTAKPLVDDVFKVGFAWFPVSYPYSITCLFLPFGQGYNVTVMAYGQTGSGKTYTMGTSDTALSQDTKIHGWIYIFDSHTSSYYCDCQYYSFLLTRTILRSIVPRFMSSIFERVKEFGSRRKVIYQLLRWLTWIQVRLRKIELTFSHN